VRRHLLLLLLAALVAGAGLAAGAAEPGTYLAGLQAELEKTWPANRAVHIVCHGHSVPAGYFRTPVVDSFNAYPHLLHRALKDRYPRAVINVIVTAVGGESSDQGAARFEREVLAHRPDLLLIDYGLNDRRIGLGAARKAWVHMIEQAQARGVRVLLLTPTADLGARMDDPTDPLLQHAAQIRELAATYDVALADSLAATQACVRGGDALATLMAQSNHPNRKGHELVLRELMRWFPEAAATAP